MLILRKNSYSLTPFMPLGLAFSVLALLFIVPTPILREKLPIPNRVMKSGGSVSERLIIWKATSEMIRASQGKGIGIGQFKLQYLPAYARLPLEIKRDAYSQDFPRQNVTETHNEYLQVLCETGLLGLFSFLLLLTFTFVKGLKTFFLEDVCPFFNMRAGALSGLLSLFLASLFGFPFHLPQSLALSCILSAMCLYGGELKTDFTPETHSKPNPCFIAITLLCIFSAIAVTVFSLMAFSSSIHLRSARKAQAAHDHAAAQREFEKALSLTPHDGETLFYTGIFMVHIGETRKAYHAFKKAEDTVSNLNLTMAFAKTAQQLGKYGEAVSQYNKALKLYPWKEYQCAAYLELGNIYILQKKNTRASKAFRGALKFCEKETLREEISEKIKRTYGR